MRYLGYSFGQICTATENPTKSNANRASDLDRGVKRGSRLKSTTLPSQRQCAVKSYLTQEREGKHHSFYLFIGSHENKKSKFIRKHEEEKKKDKINPKMIFFLMWCSGTV